MKPLALALLAATAAPAATAVQWRDAAAASSSSSSSPNLPPQRRATDRSPRRYTPSTVDCPDRRPTIRNGSSLSPQEREWLPRRRNETLPHVRALLKRIAIPGFDSDEYLRNAGDDDPALAPTIGLAVSGGGYRAMLTGAGVLAAFDSRSPGTETAGNLGGLLQSATYLSGLSGGGWLVGSLYINNFTSVVDAINSPNIWQFDDSILKGPEQYSLLQYYRDILDDVDGKKKAGYDTSITDYWGRMLSYQLINAHDGGPAVTFSSIADDADFSDAKAPLPFLIADGRAPGEKPVEDNTTVFEFNPWELGSTDASLNGFAPLQYVGSKFNNGELPDDESCVVGFDNAGFVMGTSSSLFNQVVLYLRDGKNRYVPSDVPGFVVDAIKSLFTAVGEKENDIADWTPNPFKGWNRGRNPDASADRLTLVDGGEDRQNIPYAPHLIRDRAVDVVFSIDSSADTDSGWPDGASAMATYRRSLVPGMSAAASSFPSVPGTDTFLNMGLNTRPVFFGCDAANFTSSSFSSSSSNSSSSSSSSSSSKHPPPLIVYLPNYPYIYASNISTFQMSISSAERDALVGNGWALATQLNATRDRDWPVCVACAVLARSFYRSNISVPDACRACFDRYCWDGRVDDKPAQPYHPSFAGEPVKVDSSLAALAVTRPSWAVTFAGAALALAAAGLL